MDISVRRETKDDYLVIKTINDSAFGRTTESELIEKLREKDDFLPELSLIAETDELAVGYTLLYPVKINCSDKEHVTLALAPIAVLPEYQNKGIGQKLVKESFKRAKELGYKSILVLGDPSFFKKFGFKPCSQWNIKSPFSTPDETFMAIELEEGALEEKAGSAVYPEEYISTIN